MKKLIIGLLLLIYSLSFGWDIGQVIQRIKNAEGINANVSIQTDPQKIKNNLRAIGDFSDNAGVAVGRTVDSASDLGSSIINSDGDIGKTADKYQDKTARREALSQLNAEELDLIQNPDKYDLVSQQYVADKFNKAYSEIRGLDHAEAVLFDDAKLENEQGVTVKASKTTAFYDPDQNNIYLEADKIQKDNKMAHALGHESKRQDLHQKDSTEGDQTAIAFEAGSHTKKAFERELKYKKVGYNTKPTYVRTNADNDAIAQGSKQASQVENVQPWVETGWDAANVGMGVASGVSNLKHGNYGDAVLDGLGIIADGASVVVPGLPGGAGTAIKAIRAKKKLSTLAKRQKQVKINSIKGTKREKIVQAELEQEHGIGNVLQQRTILDKNGKKIKHHKTGTGRRLDHVVLDKQGNAIQRVETTSLTAPKSKQLRKERDIMASQDTYIRHPETKELIPIKDTTLQVKRLE